MAVTPTPLPHRPAATHAGGAARRHNEGHGRRLTAAFDALEAFFKDGAPTVTFISDGAYSSKDAAEKLSRAY